MGTIYMLVREVDSGRGYTIETVVKGYRVREVAEQVAERLNVALEQPDWAPVVGVHDLAMAQRGRPDRTSYCVKCLEVN